MDVKVNRIAASQNERIEIYCHKISDEVKEIVAFVKSRQGQIAGTLDDKQYEIPVTDILYVEAVDNKCFVYTAKKVYETRERLYVLEELLLEKRFLRVSKSALLNVMKIDAIKPALNGRFIAILSNGENVIISRKYVKDLKRMIQGA